MSAIARRGTVLPPDFGPKEFAKACGVSRETLMRLKVYVGLLAQWNERHNLAARSTMTTVWKRHVWDSAQLVSLIPDNARRLVDLGSGAGFPGLVLAILLRERPGFRAVLYEATRKKCDFLEAAAGVAGVHVEIHNTRIEQAKREPFEIVTARACAPLSRLLSYAQPFQAPHTANLLLKGQNVEAELTEAHKSWRMTVKRHPSQTDPSGVILEVRELAHV